MNNIYGKYAKRIIDLIVSFILIIALSPIFVPLIFILYIANNGNPFFYQSRPGLNYKSFRIIKFKTMNDKRGDDGKLLPDSIRTTKVGYLLRKTSLDELPQLFNVLIGDMSLIGPRPLLFEYIPLYQENQSKRHLVRPGITGWAQVNGRNTISWTSKFSFDVWYVENLTLILDLRILILTCLKVVKRKDVDFQIPEGERRFNGYN
jgi:lipopolysaccharide/colanic/teichoic acid biosynthesis glycosyltransferase